jgi:curved DNA-binding protein CbpA
MKNNKRSDPQRAPSELRAPLATLGLSWPTTLDAVKSRYKELAKRHHPDANGGSRDAEERLKTINLAYAAVRSRLGTESRVAAAE